MLASTVAANQMYVSAMSTLSLICGCHVTAMASGPGDRHCLSVCLVPIEPGILWGRHGSIRLSHHALSLRELVSRKTRKGRFDVLRSQSQESQQGVHLSLTAQEQKARSRDLEKQ